MSFNKSVAFAAFILACTLSFAQDNSVGINTNSPNSNAVLELVSPNSNQGFLVPRLTTAQRNSMSLNNLDNGLMVFDTDADLFYFWNNGSWKAGLGVINVSTAGGDLTGNYPNPVIRTDAVFGDKIRDDGVSTDKIQNSSIITSKIADNAVTTDKLADFAVTGQKLEDVGITPSTYGNQFTVLQLTVDSKGRIIGIIETPILITSTHITNLTILNEDIANGTIKISKLDSDGNTDKVLAIDGSGAIYWEDRAAFTSSVLDEDNIYIGNSSSVAEGLPVSGDVSITNSGSSANVQIEPGVIVNADINASAGINTAKLADGSVSNTEFQNINNLDQRIATTDNVTFNNVQADGSLGLAAGTTVNELSTDGTLVGNSDDALPTERAVKNYVDTQVDAENDLTEGSIFVGDATNNQSEVDASADGQILIGDGTTINSRAVSGDFTIDNTGLTDLVAGAVEDDEVDDDLTINGGDIDNTPIDASVIGGTTPAAASFTVTNTDNIQVDGNTISSTDTDGNVVIDPNGTGVVDVNTSIISNVTDPVANQDAATKNYVDTQVDAENDLTEGSIFVGDATNNQSEVDASADGQILIGDGTTINSRAVSGDFTIDNTGLTDLVAGAVEDDEVDDDLTINGGDIDNTPIDASVIGGTTPAAASFTVTNTDNIQVDGNTISSTDTDGNVVIDPNGTGVVDVNTSIISNVTDPVANQDAATKNYVDTQVDAENDLTEGSIFVGDATNNQSEVDASADGQILIGDGTTINSRAVSGDFTIDNTGLTDLVAGAVEDDEVDDDLTINGGDIDNTPIDASVIGGTTPAAASFTVTNTDNIQVDGNTISSTDTDGNVVIDPNGTGVVDVNTSIISNVTDPVANQDAATKNYVDTQVDAENDLTEGSIFVGDATNNQSEVDASADGQILIGDGTTINSRAVSGDFTIDNTGLTDLVAGAVEDDEVDDDLTINGGDIDNTPIDASVIGGTTPAAASFTVTNTDNIQVDGNTISSTDTDGNVVIDPNGTGVVDVNTSIISNVTDPVANQDAATKNYVDTQVDAENDLTEGSIFVGDATNNQSEVDASADGQILIGDGTTINSRAVSGDFTIDNTGLTDLVAGAVEDDEVDDDLTINGGDIDNTPIDASVIGGTTPAAASFTVTNTDNIQVDGNTISSTDTDGNVVIDPNGTGVVDVNTSIISNVTDPVANQDAATKNYVDTQVDAENDLTEGSIFVGDATNNQSEVDASADGQILIGDGTTINSRAVSGDFTIDNTGLTDLVAGAVEDDEVDDDLTINGGDIDNTPIDASVIGGTTPAAASFTVTNTDNIQVDGNTISSTDTDGNVVIDPNGTGVVDVNTSIISNVTDPVANQDAATKNYVDTQVDAENDLTEGSIFVGDATNNQSEVDASADGQILIGDGTTINSRAVSGDFTIDNTGLTDLVAGAVEDDEVDDDLTINGGDIDNTPIDASVIGGTTPAAASFTVTNTDNIQVDGNTISSTDTDGNVVIDPNGTGVVDVNTSIISNVTDPVANQDAATKNYVDTQVDAENDLTEGSIFVGDATNNQSEVDASADGQILIGDGTTINSRAVSGDFTIDNTGLTDLVAGAVEDDEVDDDLTINGGDIDNTPIDASVIGGTTPAAASFTVTNTDNIQVDGNTISSTDTDGNVVIDPNGTGVVDVNTSIISNVTDPVANQDAATKNYVDTQVDAENDLTEGSIFVGDATNNQSEVDASADGQVLIGDGTTINSRAVSGDFTIDNTGLTDLVAGAVEDDEVDDDLTINGGDIDNTPIDASVIGGTTPAAASFTVTNTDNIQVDGNTISSTDTDGNVVIDPNGTGVVDVNTSIISNVTDPVANQDAATKNYVDTQVDAENDLTEGSIFVGDATNNQSEVDASADGQILIGDGTTINSRAVSGDFTIDNTGLTDLVAGAVEDDEVDDDLTINGGDIDNTPIDASVIGGTTPAAASFTVTNTDNIQVDGNTISSTDTDGNVVIDPNGTGVVDVNTSIISNVTDPVANQDAATKNYVDTQVDAENDLTEGSIFVGDATNNQSEVDASADGQILIGDGTTINSRAVSGDFTIDNTGLTDLVAGAVEDDEVDDDLTINGGDIDNTPIDASVIGGTTPAAASFTVTNTDNIQVDGNTISSTDTDGNVVIDPNGTGVVDVNTSIISNVTDPVANQDAATKNYVDTQVDAENDLTEGSIFVGDATNNQSEVDASADGQILIGDGTTINSRAVSGDFTIDNTGLTDLVAGAVEDDEVDDDLTINGGDIDNTPIDASVIGGTTPAAASFTVTNTDNIQVDGNTISSTDTDGNVVIDPNGTGVVDVNTSIISNVTDPVANQDAATKNYVDTQVDAENDLTEGSIFVGDATNNQSEVDASADGQILIGDGTTINSRAVSGDFTIDNTGLTDLVAGAVEDDEVDDDLTINGGDIDNTPIDASVIGGTTPAAASFTVTNTDNIQVDGNTISSTDTDGNVVIDPNGTGVVDVNTSIISNVTDPVANQDAATKNYVDTQVDAENDLTEGSIFVGDATNNQSEVDASADGQILIGDGTTINSRAVSGDFTIDNTGLTDLVAGAVEDDEVDDDLTINGGDIDNTPIDASVIGGTTPAAASFTVTNTDNIQVDGNTISSTDTDGNVVIDPNGTGVVDVNTSIISNVTDPVGAQDAATKNYVDTEVTAINTLADGNIYMGDGTNQAVEVVVSGDATLSNTGVLDLNNNAVEDAEVVDALTIDGGSVTNSDVTIPAANTLDVSAGTLTLAANQITDASVVNALTIDGGSVTNSDVTIPAANTLDVSAGTFTVANDQISGNAIDGGIISNLTDPVGAQDAATKNYVDTEVTAINTLADGNIYMGDGTNQAVEVVVSGDATLSNTGVLDLNNNAVEDAEVVDALTIDGGSVTNSDVTIPAANTLDVSAGTLTLAANQITDASVVNALTIDGGSVTNSDVTIPAANTLDVSAGTFTVANDQISGNAIDGGIISNLTDPVGAQDAATKNYVDTEVTAINTLADGNIYMGDGTNQAVEVVVSGDATLSNTGVLDLNNNAVEDAEVVDALTIDGGSVTNSDVTIPAANTLDVSAGTLTLAANQITDASVVNALTIDGGSVTNSDVTIPAANTLDVSAGTFTVANDQISGNAIDGGIISNLTDPVGAQDAATKNYVDTEVTAINTLADGNIYMGDGTNQAVEVVVSGDATLSNTGVLDLNNNAVEDAEVVDALTIDGGSVTNSDVTIPAANTLDVSAGTLTLAANQITDASVVNALTIDGGSVTNSDVTIPAANTLDVSAGTFTVANDQISGNAIDGGIISNLTDPVGAQDAATKNYVDTEVTAINTLADGNIYMGDGTNQAVEVVVSGDATLSNTGVLDLNNNAVEDAEVVDALTIDGGSVTNSDVTIPAANTLDVSAGTLTLAANQITDASVVNALTIDGGSVTNSDVTIPAANTLDVSAGTFTVANDQISGNAIDGGIISNLTDPVGAQDAATKNYVDTEVTAINTLADGNIYMGDGTNQAVEVVVSGDATLSNTGVLDLNNNAVEDAEVVDALTIDGGSVTNSDVTIPAANTLDVSAGTLTLAANQITDASVVNALTIDGGSVTNSDVTIPAANTLDVSAGTFTVANDQISGNAIDGGIISNLTDPVGAQDAATKNYVDTEVTAINTLADGNIYMGDGTNQAVEVVVSGDATLSNTGVLDLNNNAVEDAEVVDALTIDGGSVTNSDVTIPAANTLDVSAGTLTLAANQITDASVVNALTIDGGSVTNSDVTIPAANTLDVSAGTFTVANDQISGNAIDGGIISNLTDPVGAQDAATKNYVDTEVTAINTLADGNIYMGDGTNQAVEVVVSGDATLSNTGVLDLNNNAVEDAEVVDALTIDGGSVTNSDVTIPAANTLDVSAGTLTLAANQITDASVVNALTIDGGSVTNSDVTIPAANTLDVSAGTFTVANDQISGNAIDGGIISNLTDPVGAQDAATKNYVDTEVTAINTLADGNIYMGDGTNQAVEVVVSGDATLSNTGVLDLNNNAVEDAEVVDALTIDGGSVTNSDVTIPAANTLDVSAGTLTLAANQITDASVVNALTIDGGSVTNSDVTIPAANTLDVSAGTFTVANDQISGNAIDGGIISNLTDPVGAQDAATKNYVDTEVTAINTLADGNIYMGDGTNQAVEVVVSGDATLSNTGVLDLNNNAVEDAEVVDALTIDGGSVTNSDVTIPAANTLDVSAGTLTLAANQITDASVVNALTIDGGSVTNSDVTIPAANTLDVSAGTLTLAANQITDASVVNALTIDGGSVTNSDVTIPAANTLDVSAGTFTVANDQISGNAIDGGIISNLTDPVGAQDAATKNYVDTEVTAINTLADGNIYMGDGTNQAVEVVVSGDATLSNTGVLDLNNNAVEDAEVVDALTIDGGSVTNSDVTIPAANTLDVSAGTLTLAANQITDASVVNALTIDGGSVTNSDVTIPAANTLDVSAGTFTVANDQISGNAIDGGIISNLTDPVGAQDAATKNYVDTEVTAINTLADGNIYMGDGTNQAVEVVVSGDATLSNTGVLDLNNNAVEDAEVVDALTIDGGSVTNSDVTIPAANTLDVSAGTLTLAANQITDASVVNALTIDGGSVTNSDVTIPAANTLDVSAGTFTVANDQISGNAIDGGIISNLTDPVGAQDAATKNYVDTEVTAINTLADGNIYMGDGTNQAVEVVVSGDATLSNTGVLDLNNNAVEDAEVVDALTIDGGSVTNSDVTIPAANTLDVSAGTLTLAANQITDASVVNALTIDGGSVTNSDVTIPAANTLDVSAGTFTVANDQISGNAIDGGIISNLTDPVGAQDAATKNYVDTEVTAINTLADGNIYMGDGTNQAVEVVVSGDATLSNTGVLDLNNNAVEDAEVVDALTIDGGSVTNSDVTIPAANTLDVSAGTLTLAANQITDASVVNALTIDGGSVTNSDVTIPAANTLDVSAGTFTVANDQISGNAIDGGIISNLTDPVGAQDAATKNYVDTEVTAINTLADGNIYMGDGTNQAVEVVVSGDATLSNTGVLDLNNNAVEDAEVVDALTIDGGSVTNSDVTIPAANTLDVSAGTLTLAANQITDASVVNALTIDGGSVTNSDVTIPAANTLDVSAGTFTVANDQISGNAIDGGIISNLTDPVGAQDAATKNYVDTEVTAINTLADGNIYMGDGTNQAVEVVVSGDATLSNTGVLDLNNNAVEDAEVVDALTIDGGSVTNSDVTIPAANTLDVSAGTLTLAANQITDASVVNALTIDGGSVTNSDVTIPAANTLDVSAGTFTVANDQISGNAIDGGIISNLTDPVGAQDAATKNYVDTEVTAINTLADGNIYMGDGTNQAVEVVVSGDATLSNTGVLDLNNNAVEDAEVVDALTIDGGSVTNSDVTIPAANTLDVSAGTLTLAANQITDASVVNALTIDGGSVTNSDVTIPAANTLDVSAGTFTVANDQISGNAIDGGIISNLTDPVGAQDAATKNYVDTEVTAINTLADGNIYMGDGTNQAVEVVVSGDATLSNTGVLDLNNNAVEDAEVVDALTIDGGSVTNSDVTIPAANTLDVSAGTLTLAANQITDASVVNALTIDGGSVTNSDVTIPAANTLDVSAGTFTVANDQISGNAIDGGIISNLTDPVGAQDAATKNYVDTEVTAINTLADGNIYMGDGTNQAVEVVVSGDATLSNTGVLDLNNNAVEDAEVVDALTIDGGSVTNSDVTIPAANTLDVSAGTLTLAANQITDASVVNALTIDGGSVTNSDVTIPAANTLDVSAGTLTLAANQITDASVVNALTIDGGSVTNSDVTIPAANTLDVSAGTFTVANDQISGNAIDGGIISNLTDPVGAQDAATKNYVDTEVTAINTLADGNIYMGDGTNQAVEVVVSGDATLSNTGVLDLNNNAVEDAEVVDALTIDGGSVTNSDVTIPAANTLDVSAGTFTVANDQISGNAIDGGIISNLTDPVGAQDAATKNYVDTEVTAVQTELDAVETGAGLSATGTYVTNTGTNYIDGATSLDNADDLLDAAINLNTTDISNLETLSGAGGATNLGTFTGAIIADNETVKGALQDLEDALSTAGTMATQNANSVTITGGSINGTAIGATTASSGRFTGITVTSMPSGPSGSAVFIDGSGVLNSSDRRLKENISLLQNTLSKLDQLGGYNYNYKADEEKKKQIGVIAQELEKVFPELVNTDDRGYKMVNYQGLIPVLVQAIKEQQIEINQLNQRVANQESKLSKLESDNTEMKNDLDLIKKMLLGEKSAKEDNK